MCRQAQQVKCRKFFATLVVCLFVRNERADLSVDNYIRIYLVFQHVHFILKSFLCVHVTSAWLVRFIGWQRTQTAALGVQNCKPPWFVHLKRNVWMKVAGECVRTMVQCVSLHLLLSALSAVCSLIALTSSS